MRHILIAVLLQAVMPLYAQNAADILAEAAAIMRQPGGLTASFAINTRQGQSSESFEGVIDIKGDKFTLVTPGMKTWYDGHTQWTYIESAREVNITTPEGDDLQLTNPAILLNSYQKNFTATTIGSATATGSNGKAAHNIELTPRSKSDIIKVNLLIEKSSSLPVRITVELKNNVRNTINISDIKTNPNHPDNYFSFPQSSYPDAEIIDLRPRP
ncbi:MAG: hypothetical protein LBI58_06575 [Tannerellaceae bacterium]|jgi:outer membrane lipoprotein-sorting protein|nr:hypothetical protein [Tannerellaceae bacterium]